MKILMLETHRGCEDGFHARRYHKGKTYDISSTLACAFVNNGWAVTVEREGL